MANGSPDGAFELLLLDPAQLDVIQDQMLAGGQDGQDMMQEDEGDYGDEMDMPDGGNLAAFMNNPQFQMLRQRMLQNPQFFTEFMETL